MVILALSQAHTQPVQHRRRTSLLLVRGTTEHSPINILVDKKNGKIQWVRLVFWKDFDNHAFLKEKFSKDKRAENPLDSPKGDVVSEPVHITIPELAISFEYDNHLPQRRVMEVFFE